MKTYKVLVLTDHSQHSDQNSIYALLNEMKDHPQCRQIDIVTRGMKENQYFFDSMQRDALFGCKVTSAFRYSKDGKFFNVNLKKLRVKEYQLVFLRLPRPISDEFLSWIEEVFSHATIINRPSGIIATSNKKYLLNFPEVCPDIRLCMTVSDILEEASKFPIVLKPLKEYGGKGLLRIDGDTLDDGNEEYDTLHYLNALSDDIENEGMLSMKYLKNVSEGDKRILVVGGEIQAASLRLPAKGSWLCNVAQGGKSVPTEISEEEKAIIKKINPKLMAHGIVIYGADTLVDDNGKRILSEVNTLSIGGFPQAQAQSGKPIIKQTIDKIFEYANDNE